LKCKASSKPQQIKQAIDAQLAAKGMVYQVAVRQERQWNGYDVGGGIRWGATATATSSTIHVGTLVLDMYDPATKRLVGTGNATKTLDPSSNSMTDLARLAKIGGTAIDPFTEQPVTLEQLAVSAKEWLEKAVRALARARF
jgi:hypothetical protein